MKFSKMVVDLYRIPKTEGAWKRVKRRKHDSERLLQEALQAPKNQHILRMGHRHVRWIGREFASADFFGIDEKWNLVFVETKVSSQQAHLAHQLRERVNRFLGKNFKNVDERIWKYVYGQTKDEHLMKDGLRLRELYHKGRIQSSKDVAAFLKRKIGKRRPPRVRRLRFIAVSPYLNDKFAKKFEQVRRNLKRRERKAGSISLSCVLLTPYLVKRTVAVARIEF
jgi:hypothetical protein